RAPRRFPRSFAMVSLSSRKTPKRWRMASGNSGVILRAARKSRTSNSSRSSGTTCCALQESFRRLLHRVRNLLRLTQPPGIDFALRLDPLRSRLPLLIRPVHRERRYNAALRQPPDTDACAVRIAARDRFLRDTWISPQFVRQIEHIGEEVGDMLESGTLAHERARAVLPLRDGIVPVFHAPPLPEYHVLVIRDVAGRINAGVRRLQVLVDSDAIRDIGPAAPENLDDGTDPDTCDNQ